MKKTNSNDKGASPVIGFILVFAITIAFISYAQVTYFEAKNLEAENKAHDETIREMKVLHSKILELPDSNISKQINFKTTVDYPPQFRPVFDNPDIIEFNDIENSVVLSNTNNDKSYNSTYITYVPLYTYYSQPEKITHEMSVTGLYNENNSVTLTSSFVQNNTTFLIQKISSKSKSIQSKSPSLSLSSSDFKTIHFKNSSSVEPTLTIKTKLKNQTWQNILSEPIKNGTIKSTNYTENQNSINSIELKLKKNTTYHLKKYNITVENES